MSLNAYRKVQTSTDNPTQTEYRVFAQVTAALVRARDEKMSGPALMDVLHWNKTLWSALSSDCAAPGNKLPKEVRAQIISLSLFVSKYTSKVFRKEGDIETLIEINRAIMGGLEAQITAQDKSIKSQGANAGNDAASSTQDPQPAMSGKHSYSSTQSSPSPQRTLGGGINA